MESLMENQLKYTVFEKCRHCGCDMFRENMVRIYFTNRYGPRFATHRHLFRLVEANGEGGGKGSGCGGSYGGLFCTQCDMRTDCNGMRVVSEDVNVIYFEDGHRQSPGRVASGAIYELQDIVLLLEDWVGRSYGKSLLVCTVDNDGDDDQAFRAYTKKRSECERLPEEGKRCLAVRVSLEDDELLCYPHLDVEFRWSRTANMLGVAGRVENYARIMHSATQHGGVVEGLQSS